MTIPPGDIFVAASRRVPSETDSMIDRMRSSDDEDEAAVLPPSASSSPKAGNSGGRPPRAPTAKGNKFKSTAKHNDDGGNNANDETVEAAEDEGRGFVRTFLSKISGGCDAGLASATTCLIPGAQCGDIEQGEFDLGRIDDLAEGLYNRAAGGGKKQANFDDETILSDTQTLADHATIVTMDTGADTGYYTNFTGATGFTEATDASASLRGSSSTIGRGTYKGCADDDKGDIEKDNEDDLLGEDDDINTIQDGAGLMRSSTFQSALTMNTISTFGTGVGSGVGKWQSVKRLPQSTRSTVVNTASAVNTISAIGATDDAAISSNVVPLRQRTQSTHQTDATEPTRLVRKISNATGVCTAVSSERRSRVCVGASIEVELGKEPNTAQLPSTAVDIDECSIDEDDDEDDDEEEEIEVESDRVEDRVSNVAKEAKYNIVFVKDDRCQEGPLAKERSLNDHPSLSTDPSTSEETFAEPIGFGEEGEEIDYASFKKGLEDCLEGAEEDVRLVQDIETEVPVRAMNASENLDNKNSNGALKVDASDKKIYLARPGSIRGSSPAAAKGRPTIAKPPFFASPNSQKKVAPPPFFASSDKAGEKSGKTKLGETKKKKNTPKKIVESPIDLLETTAETMPLDEVQ
mmetsp:Transcript_3249/g.9335  ORF Transcript_3249/g.9335 Transcript_3249/m.9335 type:complete len:634 (+) Transcript_3249:298-2199(+)|eukprot:CAMPEP_0181044252 /NCGR_PEP_ID=MMETSP1070-20121207/13158_1 /TAXON_ID=265543 /ORGANISM="Minutocellus polymorphus, Strain NH13" /LENGTH=633 /DNA_ID=CAMNT_0023122667 /DNA_START=274 /DNA_END=2175 /DNA_ORIENTATION=+